MKARMLSGFALSISGLVVAISNLPGAGLPDLAPIAIQTPDPLIAPPNPIISVAWGVTNRGTDSALGYWFDSLSFTSNSTPDAPSLLLSQIEQNGPLPAGSTYWQTSSIYLPVIQSGKYSFILKTDSSGLLSEADESNNQLFVSFNFQSTPADLVPIALQLPTVVTGPPNPVVSVVWGVTDQGIGAAVGGWTDFLILSTNDVYDSMDYVLTTSYENQPVAPGTTYWRTNLVRFPITKDGTYYVIFQADLGDALNESQTNNNQMVVPITFHILPPDLAPLTVELTNNLVLPPKPIVSIIWAVTNLGPGEAIGDYYSWFDDLYLSTNPIYDPSLPGLLTLQESGSVEPGGVYWRTNQVLLPITASGRYYLIFIVNQFGQLFETNSANNTLVVPLDVQIQPSDLLPVVSQIPSAIVTVPNPTLTFVWGVTNQGIGAAVGSWSDIIAFSTSSSSTDGSPFSYEADLGPLLPGNTFWHTNSLQLPITQSGTYYLLFNADAYNYLYETDESNNFASVPVNFTLQFADLAPLVLKVSTVVTSTPNPTLSVSWAVTNQDKGSPAAYQSWADAVYFSTDGRLDGSQRPLWVQYTNGPLNSGSSYPLFARITIPAVQSGTYYLIFVTDVFGSLLESNESNNSVAVPITFDILQPDLAIQSVQSPNQITGPPYPTATVAWCVTNQGVAAAIGGWVDTVTFSTDSVLDPQDSDVGYNSQQGPLVASASYWITNSISLPVVESGSYFLFFRTDPFNSVFESDTNNNTVMKPISVTIHSPDLAVMAFMAPTIVTSPPNPNITFTWAVTNQGTGDAIGRPWWNDTLSVSTNSILDPSAGFVASFHPTPPFLASGDFYWQTNSVRVPVVQNGTYYFFLTIDSNNFLYESDESNNVSVLSITFVIQPPDLAPVGLQAPSQITDMPNPTIIFAWGVTNQGIGAAALASGSWSDTLYVSQSPMLDYNAVAVASAVEDRVLMPGRSYWMTNSVQLPVTTSGTYYLLLKTDANNDVFESNETNNVIVRPISITILPPDLVPFSLQVLGYDDGQANPSVLIAWGVTNQGPGEARGHWIDNLRFSQDTNFSSFATPLLSSYQWGPIPAGGTYRVTNSVRVPVIESGIYYFGLQVNDDNYFGEYLFEATQTNNNIFTPVTFNVNLPDLSPVLLSAPSQISGSMNPTVIVSWGVTNQGAGPAVPLSTWYDQLYISTNSVLDSTAAAVGTWFEPGPISAGHVYWRTHSLELPLTRSGAYYLFLVTDAGRAVAESNETNNVIAAKINFNLDPPDLAPIAFIAPQFLSAPPNPWVNLVWGVTNQGTGLAQGPGGWVDQLYLSDNNQFDPFTMVAGFNESGPFVPGSSYWRTNRVRLPLTQNGDYHLFFQTDSGNSVPELDESNNVAVVPLKFNIAFPDLVPFSFQAPKKLTGSQSIPITLVWGVTNQGLGAAAADYYWSDTVFLAKDPTQPGTLLNITSGYQFSSVDPGGTYWITNSGFISGATNGDWYLILRVNDSNLLSESDINNNTLIVPITLEINQPDLAPIALQAPTILDSPAATVVWAVTNLGPGTAATFWYDSLWLSTNSSVDGMFAFLGNWQEVGPVSPGGSYWRTNTVGVPDLQPGNYFLIFEVNPGGQLSELSLTNNFIVRPITIDLKPADLVPIVLQAPVKITGPPFPLVQVGWAVTNQGPGAAFSFGRAWVDALFISTNVTTDGIVAQVAGWTQTNAIAAGQVYGQTNLVSLPLITGGNYYLLFQANVYGLAESNLGNNLLAVPFTFNVQFPDLGIISWHAPTQIVDQPWPALTFVVGITNQGQGAARGNPYWTDSLYLSQAPFFDYSTIPLQSWFRSNTLASGSSYWQTNSVVLPTADSADYYLIFITDTSNSLGEQELTNNTVISPLSLNLSPPSDLAVDTFLVPPLVIGTATPTVTVISHVINQGLGVASGTWTDMVSLALGGNVLYPGPARQLVLNQESHILLSGDGYWRTNIITMPEMQSGRYRLSYSADSSQSLYDADIDNNSAASSVDFNLTAPEPSRLGQGFLLRNGWFELPFYGSFGPTFTLQVSTNLVDWESLYLFVCTATPMTLTDTPIANVSARFYRVVTPPPTGPPIPFGPPTPP